jgi:hypothetical protein
MHNEKPNNPLSDKLDGMNSLPEGFGFSATRVWDQLEQQLQTQPAKPNWLWMRYAAAIVLLVSAATIWLLQKQTPIPTNSFTKQTITKTVEAPATTSKIEATELLAKKEMPVKNKLLISKSEVLESTQLVQTSISIEPSLIKDSIQTNETIAVAISSPAVTTKPAVKSTPIRKKYPVVHLYDLYREPEPIYTKSAPKRTITETDDSPVDPVETNRSFWFPKPKPVIITTSLTDNQ